MAFLHDNIVPAKDILNAALKNGIGVGAFNFSNLETLKAMTEVCGELNYSFIAQITESSIKYIGENYLVGLVQAAAESSSVNFALHLDHGSSFDICKRCIDLGFSSVMIDKSSLSIEENISETNKVIDYAKGRGVSVEAEIGILAGVEDHVESDTSLFTKPEDALRFKEETGVDALAVSVGTAHGPFKAKHGKPKIDINRLAEIKSLTGDLPLVLHGASSVYTDLVDVCNKYGAEIEGSVGISDNDIVESIKNGIAKINVDTDLRLAFLAGIRSYLGDRPKTIDIRKYAGSGSDKIKETIRRKIKLFTA